MLPQQRVLGVSDYAVKLLVERAITARKLQLKSFKEDLKQASRVVYVCFIGVNLAFWFVCFCLFCQSRFWSKRDTV